MIYAMPIAASRYRDTIGASKDLLNSSAVWQTLPQHPNILPVADAVLGDDCLLNTYGTSTVGPGESEQPIHVDDVDAHLSVRFSHTGKRVPPGVQV